MHVRDIVERLVLLGLGRAEAETYVHLSIVGSSKASSLATAMKIHRTEAYRTLQRLVQAGFVTASLSRPVRFEAEPPEKVFRQLERASEAQTESIRRAEVEIGHALSTLRAEPHPGLGGNAFRVVQGRREIFRVLDRMIRGATRSLDVVTTHAASVQLGEAAGLTEALRSRKEDDLRVRVILKEGTRPPEDLAGFAEHRFTDVEDVVRFAVADGKEMLIWVVHDASTRMSADQEVAIWTDAPGFIAAESTLFEVLWDRCAESSTHRVHVSTRDRPAPRKLPR